MCWKALIAPYEDGIAVCGQFGRGGDPAERAALLALWQHGKFPVLRDDARERETVPETSIIIEYLDRYYRGPTRFIADDPALALQTPAA